MRQNPHVRICGGPGSATTLVYPTVERMCGTPRQVLCGHPHRRLRRATALFAHCHARQCSTRDRSCRSFLRTFTTGC